ncbi:MAG TPA: hypothetical protein VMZ04_03545, partial [Anaerolineae bacterium]|nr:hypothetical protein [Anaerolineae bacterium]
TTMQQMIKKEYDNHMNAISIYRVEPDLSGINESLKDKDEEIKKMKAEMTEMKMKLLELLVTKHETQINGTKK